MGAPSRRLLRRPAERYARAGRVSPHRVRWLCGALRVPSHIAGLSCPRADPCGDPTASRDRGGRAPWPGTLIGCGTGLVAVALSDLAVGPLVGVDVSSRMLAQAAAKQQLYAELREADLEQMLVEDVTCWKLIVAADVSVYFGALAEVFAAVQPGSSRAAGLSLRSKSCSPTMPALSMATAIGRWNGWVVTRTAYPMSPTRHVTRVSPSRRWNPDAAPRGGSAGGWDLRRAGARGMTTEAALELLRVATPQARWRSWATQVRQTRSILRDRGAWHGATRQSSASRGAGGATCGSRPR